MSDWFFAAAVWLFPAALTGGTFSAGAVSRFHPPGRCRPGFPLRSLCIPSVRTAGLPPVAVSLFCAGNPFRRPAPVVPFSDLSCRAFLVCLVSRFCVSARPYFFALLPGYQFLPCLPSFHRPRRLSVRIFAPYPKVPASAMLSFVSPPAVPASPAFPASHPACRPSEACIPACPRPAPRKTVSAIPAGDKK